MHGRCDGVAVGVCVVAQGVADHGRAVVFSGGKAVRDRDRCGIAYRVVEHGVGGGAAGVGGGDCHRVAAVARRAALAGVGGDTAADDARRWVDGEARRQADRAVDQGVAVDVAEGGADIQRGDRLAIVAALVGRFVGADHCGRVVGAGDGDRHAGAGAAALAVADLVGEAGGRGLAGCKALEVAVGIERDGAAGVDAEKTTRTAGHAALHGRGDGAAVGIAVVAQRVAHHGRSVVLTGGEAVGSRHRGLVGGGRGDVQGDDGVGALSVDVGHRVGEGVGDGIGAVTFHRDIAPAAERDGDAGGQHHGVAGVDRLAVDGNDVQRAAAEVEVVGGHVHRRGHIGRRGDGVVLGDQCGLQGLGLDEEPGVVGRVAGVGDAQLDGVGLPDDDVEGQRDGHRETVHLGDVGAGAVVDIEVGVGAGEGRSAGVVARVRVVGGRARCGVVGGGVVDGVDADGQAVGRQRHVHAVDPDADGVVVATVDVLVVFLGAEHDGRGHAAGVAHAGTGVHIGREVDDDEGSVVGSVARAQRHEVGVVVRPGGVSGRVSYGVGSRDRGDVAVGGEHRAFGELQDVGAKGQTRAGGEHAGLRRAAGVGGGVDGDARPHDGLRQRHIARRAHALHHQVEIAHPFGGCQGQCLHLSDGGLQVPVAALVGVTGGVVGGRDVGTSDFREQPGRLQPGVPGGEVTAVDEDVTVLAESGADFFEQRPVFSQHRLAVQHRVAQHQLALDTVADDVDRGHVVHLAQGFGHLLDAVARGVQIDDLGIGPVDVVAQVARHRVHEDDFTADRRLGLGLVGSKRRLGWLLRHGGDRFRALALGGRLLPGHGGGIILRSHGFRHLVWRRRVVVLGRQRGCGQLGGFVRRLILRVRCRLRDRLGIACLGIVRRALAFRCIGGLDDRIGRGGHIGHGGGNGGVEHDVRLQHHRRQRCPTRMPSCTAPRRCRTATRGLRLGSGHIGSQRRIPDGAEGSVHEKPRRFAVRNGKTHPHDFSSTGNRQN